MSRTTTTFHNPADLRRDLYREADARVARRIDPADLLQRRTPEEYREEIREARRLADVYGTTTGTIDHMPGADWHGWEIVLDEDGRRTYTEAEAPTTAPAPRHTVPLWYRPMSAAPSLTEARAGSDGRRADWITPEDALEIVKRAVSRLCGGRGYWDREDAVSYMMARLLNAERRSGRPADVLRYIDRAERMPVTTREMSALPARSVSPLALARLVADWSRRETSRAAESLDAAQESGASTSLLEARGTTADVAPSAPTFPPHHAERACDDITTALGVGRIGGVWEALYVLLRDITTEDAAPELGTTHAALRAKTSRGSKALRKIAPTPADLRRLLNWYRDDSARARKMPARPLREGTNGGSAPVRPTSADHARILCASVTLPTTAPSTTDAERITALLAA